MAQQVSQVFYFPFSTNFYSDPKIEFVEAEFGLRSLAIIQKLLCRIYENSFFCEWDEDICMIFTRRLGPEVDREYVQNVIDALIKRGFFNQEMYQQYGILTSRGIQRRYFNITSRRKNLPEFPQEYILIDLSSYQNKPAKKLNSTSCCTNESLTSQNESLTPQHVDNFQQRKEEKRREKKKKEEKRKADSLSCECERAKPYIYEKDFHDSCKTWREKLLSSAEWKDAFCRQSGLGTEAASLIPEKMNEFEDFIISGGEQSSIGSEQDYARRFHFWWQYHGSKGAFQVSGERGSGGGPSASQWEKKERPSRIEELNRGGEESLQMAYQILGLR